MGKWYETYRGMAQAWECDQVAHFTVAYYFDRFSDSVLGAMEAIGLGQDYMARTGCSIASVDCHVRWLEELRGGDVLHIESGVIGIDDKRVRLGHKVYNSANGALCATFEQLAVHFDMKRRKSLPFDVAEREAIAGLAIDWDGEPREERYSPPTDAGFFPTGRDSVKCWEIDIINHMGFQFYVHRLSAATMQAIARFGLTPEFLREFNGGFSTFEFQLRFLRELKAGDMIHIESGLMHLGGSSMRVLNRMYNSRTGELSAELSQYGVLLDMEARRPARVPDEMRERGQAMLIAAPGA
ncbi:MAG: thioesterase family protein [Alphaproteobacteria bacterium]|jgi:acyl-CoA thioesterase FadM|nr:thioesterase family protein [Alphaproteobacteria bacterium]